MKRRKRWDGPTDYGQLRDCGFRSQRGIIVLEAAIVLPIILFVLMIFSVMISFCAAQMALYSTASQSVRHIAAHIYPVELARAQLQTADATPPLEKPTSAALPEWRSIAADAAEWLPEPVDEIVSAAIRGDWQPLQNLAATELGRGVIEPYVQQYANRYILRPERVKLDLIMLPDLKDKQEPYVAIALEYAFPIKLPFTNKPIIIREHVYERVWVHDAVAAAYGMETESDADQLPLQIVSIEPTPLRPGRKATVVVKTEPGAIVSLKVDYKSGTSKAKHLGEATADVNGLAQWTWHVSGNTTAGIWNLTVDGVSKEGSLSKHFVVEKKSVDEH